MEKFIVELNESEEIIRQVIEPLLEAEGYELVRISYKKSSSKGYLVLYVDTLDHTQSIRVDQLTDISRLLSDVLDASFEDSKILHGRYELQVSSPGLDRPLTKIAHFERAVGQVVKIRTRSTGEGSRKFQGMLAQVSSHDIKIEEVLIKFDEIAEAHIVFQFA